MAGSAPTSPSSVEVSNLNLPEAAMALGHSMLRRARLVAGLVDDLVAQRRPPGEAVTAWLDGQEADLEELALRWKLAGVRWPMMILTAVVFVAGFNAGKRARR